MFRNSAHRRFSFGMAMPGRSFNSDAYRFGYQGSEKDNEISGTGNSYTTYFRQLDPRLGRWFSSDPVFQPWQSPYSSMNNNPINLNDVMGDEAGDKFTGYPEDSEIIDIVENEDGSFNVNTEGGLIENVSKDMLTAYADYYLETEKAFSFEEYYGTYKSVEAMDKIGEIFETLGGAQEPQNLGPVKEIEKYKPIPQIGYTEEYEQSLHDRTKEKLKSKQEMLQLLLEDDSFWDAFVQVLKDFDDSGTSAIIYGKGYGVGMIGNSFGSRSGHSESYTMDGMGVVAGGAKINLFQGKYATILLKKISFEDLKSIYMAYNNGKGVAKSELTKIALAKEIKKLVDEYSRSSYDVIETIDLSDIAKRDSCTMCNEVGKKGSLSGHLGTVRIK